MLLARCLPARRGVLFAAATFGFLGALPSLAPAAGPKLLSVSVGVGNNIYRMRFDQPLDPATVSAPGIYAVYEWGAGDGNPYVLRRNGGAALVLSTTPGNLSNGDSELVLWLSDTPRNDSYVVSAVHSGLANLAGEVVQPDSIVTVFGTPTGTGPGGLDAAPPRLLSARLPTQGRLVLHLDEPLDPSATLPAGAIRVRPACGGCLPWTGAPWGDHRRYLSPVDAGVRDKVATVAALGAGLGRVQGRMGQLGDSIMESQAYFTSVMQYGLTSADSLGHDYGQWVYPGSTFEWLDRDWYATVGGAKGMGWGNLSGATLSDHIAFGNPAVAIGAGDFGWATLMLGTNDIDDPGWDPVEWGIDLTAYVQGMVQLGTIPVLVTIPPEKRHSVLDLDDGRVEAANERIRLVAAQQDLPWIDLHAYIVDHQPGTAWYGSFIAADGTHLTNEGGGRNFSRTSLCRDSGYSVFNKLVLDMAGKLRAVVQGGAGPEGAVASAGELLATSITIEGDSVVVGIPPLLPGMDWELVAGQFSDLAGNTSCHAGDVQNLAVPPPGQRGQVPARHPFTAGGTGADGPHDPAQETLLRLEVDDAVGEMDGGVLLHRVAGGSSWSTLALGRLSSRAWGGRIAAGSYADGEAIEYIFRASHPAYDPGWVGLDDVAGRSASHPDSATAASSPLALQFGGGPGTAVPGRQGLWLGDPFPNPANPRVSTRVRLAAAGWVDAGLYDLAGRRVATLYRGQLPAGESRLDWRGLDDGGRAVASGNYLLSVDAAGVRQVRRLQLLR